MTSPEAIQVTPDELPQVKHLLEQIRATKAMRADGEPWASIVTQLTRIEAKLIRIEFSISAMRRSANDDERE